MFNNAYTVKKFGDKVKQTLLVYIYLHNVSSIRNKSRLVYNTKLIAILFLI